MATKLEIPVGAQFERRLAELVWENCPELARQTAAGRIALAIDVQDKLTIKDATTKAVDGAVAQLVGPLSKAASEQLDAACSVDAVKAGVSEAIKKATVDVEATMQQRASDALQEGLRKYWSEVLLNEVKRASRDLFGDREIAKVVRERLDALITEYLQHHLEPQKSGLGALIAAEAEMVTRVADAVGKRELRE